MKQAKKTNTFLSFFIFLIIIVTFVRILFIVQISGNSMYPTFSDGNYALVLPITSNITYGDIIITNNDIPYGESIIKRVIALENDTVFIDFSNGNVYVNNTLLKENYILEPTKVYGDVIFPLTVPKGCVFLLGDNRNASIDSRYSSIGCIPISKITKKCIPLF